MKQMVAPQAPVSKTMTFGELAQGFFRRMRGQGEVFYGSDRNSGSGPTYWFPVLEDGRITSHGGGPTVIYPNEMIHTLNATQLGINELNWTDETPDA